MSDYNKIVLFLFWLIIIIIPGTTLFSATVTDPLAKASYCTNDEIDTLTATSPPNKWWTCNYPGALTTIITGANEASVEFDPNQVPGPYPATVIIRYQNSTTYGDGAAVYYETSCVVTRPPTNVRFDPLADVCQTDVSFLLTEGDPDGGVYGGTGVSGGNTFDPATAGPGTHLISYTYPNTGCDTIVYQSIKVNPIPTVALSPFADVCEGDATFVLSGGSPTGGTYSGPGVAGGNFDPATAGTGTHTITYTYTSGTCTNTDSETITVNALPIATFAGLGANYCQDFGDVALTGNPTDAGGVFTGPGATSNGNGTGVFNTVSAGLGSKTVTYTYTDANGCIDTYSETTQVGTVLTMNGLTSDYCVDDGSVTVVCTPVGGTFTPLAGLTDNGDGTADFDPSTTGAGTRVIEYSYDDGTCINNISQTVEVHALPTPAFAGLAANYCTNDGTATLNGNYAPGGSFIGSGITDNGDGTGSFDPSTVAIGGPYDITYTYTDANGCSNSTTSQTNINTLPTATISGDATICEGNNTSIDISLAGSSPYDITYTNGSSNNNVTGHAGANYSTNVSPVSDQTYTVVSVTDANSCTNTGNGSATITVTPSVSITSQPTAKTICPGLNTSFSVTASGSGLTYQWSKDGIPLINGGNISGVTNPVLTINDVDNTLTGSYTCEVSSSCGGPLATNPASLALYSETAITSHPVNDYLCTGDNINLSVTAAGSNLTYQWQKDGVNVVDGGNVSGATTNTLLITNSTTANAGNYTSEVSGSCGTVESNPAIVDIDAPIVITAQPTTKEGCEGSNVSFSVTATGTSLTYQWEKDGGALAGETSQSLVLNGIVAGDAGQYKCIISSPCGESLASDVAVLSVNSTTAISTHPTDVTECTGNNASFEIVASGSSLSYQWYKDNIALVNGGNISGATTDKLIFTGLVTADAGVYNCIVTGNCGTVQSNTADLVVDDNIAITTQPTSQSICEGNNVTFEITATGSNLTYQWYKNGNPLPGKISHFLNLPSVTNLSSGDYNCVVFNSCGSQLSSNAASLTVKPLTAITAHPGDITECAGNNISLSVTADGSNNTYRWYKNNIAMSDGGNVSGATSDNLVITSIAMADGGIYHCRVSGDCNFIDSDPATLTVDDNITITNQPQDVMACENDNISFEVIATGSNLTYQWFKDGAPILSAINAVYNITGVVNGDVAEYHCEITNACGQTVSSQPADLGLYAGTSISNQPSDVTACAGTNASFNMVASGSNLTYQWYKDGTALMDAGNVSGSLTNTLNINNLTTGDDGVYHCLVNGSCNQVNSEPANLVLKDNTSISSHPTSRAVCPGTNTTFSVTANGTNLTYQWEKDGATLVGETNSWLTVNVIDATAEGTYRCVVSGDCGNAFSNGATLTVNTEVMITAQPTDKTVCEEVSSGFGITASGTGLTYQWQLNGTDLTDGGNISGTTTPSLIIDPVSIPDDGIYTCLVSGTCGDVYSDPGILTVKEKTRIGSQPADKTACPGDDITFSVTATGSNLTYQWEKNGGNLAGQTNAVLLLNNVTNADAATYRCLVSGDCGTFYSTIVTLTLGEEVNIITPPADLEVCEGNITGLSITTSGSVSAFQWKYNGGNLLDGGNLSGTQSANLSFSPVKLSNAGAYTCEITGACNTENSDPAQLIVDEGISITSQPKNKTGCPGEDITFNIVASGSNLNYQWQKDGVDLAGQSNSGLLLTNIEATDAGTYRCVITGDCGTMNSTGATLSVGTAPSITFQPASEEICKGSPAGFVVSASGTGLSYQWKYNGANLSDGVKMSGSLSNTLTIDPAALADQGVYTCEITGTCGVITTNPVNLDVNENVAITAQPISITACPGENVAFSINAIGTGITHQWQKNGTDLLGETNAILNIAGVTSANEGTYRCIVTGNCGTLNSDGAVLTVDEALSFTDQPGAILNICEGENINLSLTATGTSLTYQWRKNGTDLSNGGNTSGANSNNLIINNATVNDDGIYSCMTGSSCGSLSSDLSDVTVYPATTIVQHPVTYTAVVGGNATFSVVAEGDNLSYQWQKDGVNISDGGIISGATTSILTLAGVAESDEGNFRCVVTGTCNTGNSNPADLIVNPFSIITGQPSNLEKCENESAEFSVIATGSGLSYQWKKDGVDLADNANISGATSPNLSILSVSVSDAGSYTCQVGVENSSPAILTVNENTLVNINPVSKIRCVGDNVIFNISAKGSNLNYQWKKDGLDLSDGGTVSGCNTNTLSFSGVDVADQGVYTCYVTGTCGNAFSNPANLTVHENTAITTQPSGSTICEETSCTLSIVTTGSNLSYQWKKDGVALSDGANISGANSPSLVINNATTANQGAYNCKVIGECGSVNSTLAQLHVNPATVITLQPVDANSCETEDISFSILAEGDGLTYQWQKDGANLVNGGNISGALSTNFIITGTTSTDAGDYTCVVSGTCGVQNSDPAQLVAYNHTIITTHPIGKSICEGEPASFSVTATGDNLSYQWKKDGSNVVNGTNISGANTPNLSLLNTSLPDDGIYYCEITGSCGTEISNLASLDVSPTTTIAVQPVDKTACSGDNISYSIVATGENITYQWQKDGMDLSDGGDIWGSTASTLQLNNVSLASTGSYRCVVSGTCGSINSDPASLTVANNTLITSQPTGGTICENGSITLQVVASGEDLIYQWYMGSEELSNDSTMNGTITSSLEINKAVLANDGTYWCKINGTCGNENSSTAIVKIENQTAIDVQPAAVNACAGDDINFSVQATGTNLSYQWEKDGINLVDGANVSGANSELLILSNVSAADDGSYRCVVSGNCGIENSEPAMLNIYKRTTITSQPFNKNLCEGNQVSLSLTATGSNLVYQWKKDGAAITDTGRYSGSNSGNLLINDATPVYSGVYTCQVSGSCGVENSSAATVDIVETTSVTQQPKNKTVCENEAVIFRVTAAGDNLTYQWQKDGTDLTDNATIFGSNSNVLSLYNVSNANNGAYRCVVTGTCGIINSDAGQLTVNLFPSSAGNITGPTMVCQGDSNIIYEIEAISNASYYVWNIPVGVDILSGDSSRTISVKFNNNELGGNISVKGMNQCGAGTGSPTLTVTANPTPTAIAGANQSICIDNTTLDAIHPGTAVGQWSVLEGPGVIDNVNLNNSPVSNLREGTNIFVWTVTKDGCSSSDSITIANNSVEAEAGTNQTICSSGIYLEGNSVPYNATGSWSVIEGAATFTSGNNPVTYTTGFEIGINKLKWTINKGSCSDYDTVLIDNQAPSVSYAGIDQSICSGTTTLNGSNPSVGNGSWTIVAGSATFDDASQYNTGVSNLSMGDNILRWTTTNGICSSIDEVTLSNNQIIVNAGTNKVICDRTTTLEAEEPATGTGFWSVLKGSAVFVNNNLFNTTVTGLSVGENVLLWNVNNNGCISSDSVTIRNDSPTKADAGDDETVTSDNTTLQGNLPYVGSGSWSLISGSATIEDPTLYNTNVTSLGLGENIFRWTITNNSCISTNEVKITNFMSTTTDAGPDQTICSDETLLEGSEPVFGFGEWSVIKGSAIFSNPANPKTSVIGLAKGENILRWSIWENGWTHDDVVISNDSPTTANAGIDKVTCTDSFNLSANDPLIGKGKWTVISGAGTFINDSSFNTLVEDMAKGENIYKWTITNKACTSSDLVSIKNDLPTEAYAGENQVICTNSISLNPNTPSIGTGEWSVIGGAATFTENEANNLASGDNILRWTIVNNDCTTRDEITITNNEPSNAQAGANKTICHDSITLSGSNPSLGEGAWTIQSGSAVISDINSPTPLVDSMISGINVFRWTVTYNGCSKFDEVAITNALEVATTGADQETCSASSVLEANNPQSGNGTWSVLGGSGSAIFEDPSQPDTRVNGLDKGKNVLRWTITNDICLSYADVTITNNLPSQALAGPDQAICQDYTSLQGNSPSIGTGEWSILSGSATISSINNAKSNVTELSFGANTLRWTITNGECTSTDEVVIANNSTEESNAGIDQNICTDSIFLYANSPSVGTGQWTVVIGSANFVDNNKNNTLAKNLGKGENILRWVIENGECSSTDEVTVMNNSPTKAIAGADQTICGNTTNLQANTPEIGTGEWGLVNGSATFTDKSLKNTSVTDLNPGKNTLRWTITNGACSSSDDVIVTNDLPNVADAGNDFEICGNITPLYANSPSPGKGLWTVISGSATFDDPTRYDVQVSNLGFGTNTLRWTVVYESCTTYDEIQITNNKAKVNAGLDQTIDEPTTLLAASNPSTGIGQWTVIGGAGNFESASSAITNVTNLGAGLNTFRWSVNVNGCESFDDIAVTYLMPPNASFVVTKTTGCPPLVTHFVNNSLEDLPFMWDFGDGDTSSLASVKHEYLEPGVYKPTLTIHGINGEIIVKDTTITVYDKPDASYLIVNKEVYIPEEEAIFINTSTDATTFQWDFGDGNNSAEKDPKHTYESEGRYDITLHAWSENNCYDSSTMPAGLVVLNSGTIKFPNAFTPSLSGSSGGYYNPDDFSNDVFYPLGEGIEEYHLEIFNRWGILVFESQDILIGWDGYYDGELLNEGVYVWKVRGKYNNGREFKKVGTVLLVR